MVAKKWGYQRKVPQKRVNRDAFLGTKEITSGELHLRSINIHKLVIPNRHVFNHFLILET
jgi:hypothetical protein